MNLTDLTPRPGRVSSRKPTHTIPLKGEFHAADSDVICMQFLIRRLDENSPNASFKSGLD
jgi:hypothetical protein